MRARPETHAPPPGPIAADAVVQRVGVYGWRPRGTKDWLLTLTRGGHAVYRFPGGSYRTKAGDLVLVPPGTPHDYGVEAATGRWDVIWAHFVPRPDQMELLHWPEAGRGVRVISVPPARRRAIGGDFLEVVRQVQSPRARRQLRAMNALERVLLAADGLNPRHRGEDHDPRIEKALELIHAEFASAPALDALARKAGLSRTRFTELFHRQVGEPPRRYVERLRLRQARQLWEYGRLTLGEIAERLNFSSPFYLSLRFKKEFGVSPAFHRRKGLFHGAGLDPGEVGGG